MDLDTLTDVNFTDLDLNQDPTNPSSPSADRIEERMRHLEGVTARSRQSQRRRLERNSMVITHFSGEMIVNVDGQGDIVDGINNIGIIERTSEKRKNYKRSSSDLVAKALEMNSEVKKVDKEGGSFYDCNICLEMAKDPVLTCCGHLFCWACFYQVSYVDSTTKECPVCMGEVSDSTVIPIFGNGEAERVDETELGLKIPPRPKGRRVESFRQQRVTNRLSHVSFAEALRRLRLRIGGVGNQTQAQQEDGSDYLNLDMESQEGQNVRIHEVSRVLSESVASLSSISSALSNAERLVEDLETVINNRSRDVNSDSTADQSTGGSNSAVNIQTVTGSSETTLPVVTTSYALRRRRVVSRTTSDVDNRDTRASRRRRLN